MSKNGLEMARYAGKRTVYSFDQILSMTDSEILGIMFRFSRTVPKPIGYQELLDDQVVLGPIQSIQRIKSEHLEWIQKKIAV